jgi:hypothetical protein
MRVACEFLSMPEAGVHSELKSVDLVQALGQLD